MTTQRPGSSLSIVMRKIIPRLSKPNSALPPTFSSIRVSAAHSGLRGYGCIDFVGQRIDGNDESQPCHEVLRLTMNISSVCRLGSIGRNHGMILPLDANPTLMEFSGRTRPPLPLMTKQVVTSLGEHCEACPAMPAGFATVRRPSSLQRDPVTDRQTANALAGRHEDRVAEGRRERRHARLTDAARRDVDPVLDDVHPGIGRGLVDAHE